MKNIFRSGNPLTAAIIIVMGISFTPLNLVFGQLTTASDSGISVKNVNSIIVDSDNTKWFSTDVGIVSFDGKIWKLHDDNKSLPKQNLKSLTYIESTEGSELWMTRQTPLPIILKTPPY